ncbi:MAG: UvrD-helicase domain-containing protein [Solirubrobacteraceae bacterium]|nr:MAG: hypothetical protein DLM63_01755 [Solirubrobacterales bacterium]
MSGPPDFTAQQAAVIGDRSGDLLVAASAGSGKTAVMVERLVSAVLDDGVAIASVLAISFTDKAAGELRERVRRRFDERGHPELARDAERAFISTIHALCARILRAHPLQAGVDPSFVVLDEVDAQRLQLRAFEGALGRWMDRAGSAAVELAARYRMESLRAIVIGTVELLRSRGERRPVLPPAPAPLALDPLRDELVAAGRALGGALGQVRNGATVSQALEALQRCAGLAAGSAPSDPEALAGLALPAAGRAVALQSQECERYRRAFVDYRQAWVNSKAAPLWALLGELVSLYAERYAAAKREIRALDFSDLELEACALLQAGGEAQTRWSERFSHVMVDEFQDTNPLQLELLERVGEGRLFVVGDALQSIYRFRHADVALFRARRVDARGGGRERELAINFRSDPRLLRALDAAFRDRVFDAAEFVGLRAGREPETEASAADDAPRVELLVTDRVSWSAAERPDLGEAIPGALVWRLAEARLLAQRVNEIVDAGRFSAGDIVVLLRAAGDMALYEHALEDRGLPTYAIGGRGYFGQRQVADVVACLGVIANPYDDQALTEVLASPMVGLDVGALIALGAAAREQQLRPWQVIERWRDGGELQMAPEMASRLEEFVDRLGSQRDAAARLALDELIERVVVDSGYDLYMLSLPGGRRRLANIRKLMRLAREHERREGPRLRGFLDRVRALSGEELADREAEAPVEDERLDSVRLMTIHRAKGLEFPVVCVADLGRRRPPGADDRLLLGADGAIGLQLPSIEGPTSDAFDYTALAEARHEAEAEEERRLFYVAMTRAREHLILSGAGDPSRWGLAPDRRAEPLWWIARAMLDDPAGVFDPELPDVVVPVAGSEARIRCLLNAPATVGSVLAQASLAPQPTATAAEPVAAPAISAQPAQATLWPMSAAEVADLDVEERPGGADLERFSYSSLELHARCGYRFYLERVLGLRSLEGSPGAASAKADPGARLGALERGNLVHAALERGDLAGSPPDPALLHELARAAGIALSAPDAAELVDMLGGFFNSQLAARLRGASQLLREQPFTLVLRDDAKHRSPLVTGVIDAIATEASGEVLIVDYKTDAVSPADDLAGRVLRDYELQRIIYALAGLRAGAGAVEVAHCFLARPEEPVLARYDATQAAELQRRLEQRCRLLQRAHHAVATEPHRELCATCPGRAALCSWPSEMTMRERPRAERPAARG